MSLASTNPLRARAFDDLLRWVLLVAAIAFGAAVLWDYGFLAYLIENDTSRVSTLIIVLFCVASVYCLWCLWDTSTERRTYEVAAERLRSGMIPDPATAQSRVDRLVADLVANRRHGGEAGAELLVQALSSELRGPVRNGVFVSDMLYKLGLLGTVIGFILMLASMRDLGEFDVETMRAALQDMTGGMAVALLTTITGLGCGLLLRMQFNILDGLVLRITRGLVRLIEVELPAAMAGERR